MNKDCRIDHLIGCLVQTAKGFIKDLLNNLLDLNLSECTLCQYLNGAQILLSQFPHVLNVDCYGCLKVNSWAGNLAQ